MHNTILPDAARDASWGIMALARIGSRGGTIRVARRERAQLSLTVLPYAY